MKSDSSPDFDPLQNLLANAFAVQTSGITSDHLADLADLQRSIETGDFDLQDVLRRIAERARSVAQSSGTAIGSLDADELVYEAATGSAASYVGRRVIATLTSSTPQEPTTEILRVENADTDPRLQAAICRQFGAKSLLILPVYSEDKLRGVLQIFFDQPHQFSESEVRTYHLLRDLLADAISTAAERLRIPEAAALDTDFSDDLRPNSDSAFVPLTVADRNSDLTIPAASSSLPVPDIAKLPPPSVVTHALPRKPPAMSFLFCRRVWDVAIGAVAIITVTILLLHQDRSVAIPSAAVSNAPAAPSTENQDFTDSAQTAMPPTASDGTTPRIAKSALASSAGLKSLPAHVQHFGNDVTVRYFTPTPTILRSSADSPEVRHLSDDVTIRYFKPTRQQ